MQVSEVHDHVNHAIIGGKASIEMGISTSADFFHLLSTTLYRDQILAVVREVICNAWDSHIESGITDRPIHITVTQEHFIVTDYGKGIHNDDMGPIYGVYGNSTKKNDGTQTGGFGLGCKSPFAYTDHFEVTSCHEGVKTIYRMSKAVVQNGGKPGIIPIASIPTSETGLSVKIDMKNHHDYYRFKTLAERITFNGEMKAQINGLVKDTLGFDSFARSYHIYTSSIKLLEANNYISIRYGNVIYPMETCKELSQLTNDINEFLEKLRPSSNERYNILFQAPSHSLSVTPSRESLSMQEHTIKSIRTLFENFLAEVGNKFQPECDDYAQAVIEAAVKAKAFKLLVSRSDSLPQLKEKKVNLVLTNFKTMAEQYLSYTYPKDLSFRLADWKCRIMLMVQAKMIDRGLAQTWIRAADKVKTIQTNYYYRNAAHEDQQWLGRYVLAPLMTKLAADPAMDATKLYVIDDSDASAKYSGRNQYIIPATKAKPKHHFNTASYLRNIIVISKKKMNIHERAIQHEVFNELGNMSGYMFYHVGLKATDAEAARAFFAKTKYVVVDMIDRQEWEEEDKPDYTPSLPTQSLKTPVPRSKGLPTIKSQMKYGGINTSNWKSTENARIEKPECVIRIYNGSQSHSTNRLSWMDTPTSTTFGELFGERTAVSCNEAQYTNYIKKKGAKFLDDFLSKELVDYFNANLPEIKSYWACHSTRPNDSKNMWVRMRYEQQQMLSAIYAIPELATQYKITTPISNTTSKYIRLYDGFVNSNRFGSYPEFIALKKELDAISMNSSNKLLLKKVSESKLLSVLDPISIISEYQANKGNKQILDKLLLVITTILDN